MKIGSQSVHVASALTGHVCHRRKKTLLLEDSEQNVLLSLAFFFHIDNIASIMKVIKFLYWNNCS